MATSSSRFPCSLALSHCCLLTSCSCTCLSSSPLLFSPSSNSVLFVHSRVCCSSHACCVLPHCHGIPQDLNAYLILIPRGLLCCIFSTCQLTNGFPLILQIHQSWEICHIAKALHLSLKLVSLLLLFSSAFTCVAKLPMTVHRVSWPAHRSSLFGEMFME